MKKLKARLLGYNDFLRANKCFKPDKSFPFLVSMTVGMWKKVSYPVVAITELTLGSALNSLISFEISHPYSKEIQKRKDDFPFVVDMQTMWKNLIKSINGVEFVPKK